MRIVSKYSKKALLQAQEYDLEAIVLRQWDALQSLSDSEVRK